MRRRDEGSGTVSHWKKHTALAADSRQTICGLMREPAFLSVPASDGVTCIVCLQGVARAYSEAAHRNLKDAITSRERAEKAEADLARVTAERDALRVAASELVSWDWLHLLFGGDQNTRDVVSGVLALRKALGPGSPVGTTARCEHGRPQCLHCEAEREQWSHYVESQRDAARAQVRELLKVARAAVALMRERPSCYGECASITDALEPLDEAVDALPPSMLEDPSDG